MKWFKFYGQDYLSDPKMLALTASERSCWITLLAYASVNDNGMITYLCEDQLMAQAGLDFQYEEWDRTKGVLKKLEKLQMIQIDNEMITIKNWRNRQETNLTSYERVKRHREKKRNDNAKITLEENRIDKNRIEKKKNTPSPIGEEAKPADKQYGNPEINECVSFFKAELDGELDDSVAGNRRYAKLLLDKFRKAYPDTAPVDNVQALIRAARKDKFHKRNATSFKYLYYNAQKIIQAKKSCAGNVAII